MLILNTTGIGTDIATLVRNIRELHPNLPMLYIGDSPLDGMPDNVPRLTETFTADGLLSSVGALVPVSV